MNMQPSDLSGRGFEAFPKQCLLTREPPPAGGGHCAAFAGWILTAAPHVPLIPLLSAGRQVGLLAGWIVEDGRLAGTGEPLDLGPAAMPAILRGMCRPRSKPSWQPAPRF